jgi:hypothetical protein
MAVLAGLSFGVVVAFERIRVHRKSPGLLGAWNISQDGKGNHNMCNLKYAAVISQDPLKLYFIIILLVMSISKLLNPCYPLHPRVLSP